MDKIGKMKPVEVRCQLLEALRLDLVGPENGTDLDAEILPQAPSRWYLTGFLVPLEAGEAQKSDETGNDDLDAPVGGEESPSPEVSGRMPLRWRREGHRVEMTLNLPTETAKAVEHEVPDSNGLRVAVSVRTVQALGIAEGMVPDGTRSVSVFLVNHRIPGSDELR